jgi:hypothetical protein
MLPRGIRNNNPLNIRRTQDGGSGCHGNTGKRHRIVRLLCHVARLGALSPSIGYTYF